MSLEYNNYENNIPIVEKYVNQKFVSFETSDNINVAMNNFNSFILEDNDTDNKLSYVLRLKSDIKSYQIFACGGGGHGGLLYGNGGNGGEYCYINNITNPDKILKSGAYLINPGKTNNIYTDLDSKINDIKNTGSIYLKVYKYNIKTVLSNDLYLSDFTVNYRKIKWDPSDIISSIIPVSSITNKNDNILNFNSIISSITGSNFTIEIIFYIKQNTTIYFNNFTNSYFGIKIYINQNNNINKSYVPNQNNSYTSGNNDEMIIILCYPNTVDIPVDSFISFDNLINVNKFKSNTNDYYIYNYNNTTAINNLINEYSRITNNAKTIINYNNNYNASYSELKDTNTANTLILNAGTNAIATTINANSLSTILTNFYMPNILNANLSSGNYGTSTKTVNDIMVNLGYTNTNDISSINNTPISNFNINTVKLNNNNSLVREYKEWKSGNGGYFSDIAKFSLFAKNKNNSSIPLNNLNICNGGLAGYWQLINTIPNYTYGANGLNDFNSIYYGAYGSGGQGGSLLVNNKSLFSGNCGKNGVFILSFMNSPISDIVNNNSKILRKMFNLYIKEFTNEKFNHIIKLQSKNIPYNTQDPQLLTLYNNKLIELLINNTFIYQSKVELNSASIRELLTYISKENLTKLLGIIYIIQRIFYIIISNNIDFVNNPNEYIIDELNVNFTSNYKDEKVEYKNYKNINNVIKYTLSITIYDKINDNVSPNSNDYLLSMGYNNIKYYFSTLSINNYSSIFSNLLPSIKIINNNNSLFHIFNNNQVLIIDEKYCDNTILKTNSTQTLISDMSCVKFIVNTISYLLEIKKAYFNINVNVLHNIYNVLKLNTNVYAILYNNGLPNTNYNNRTNINNIYNNLKNYNYSIKSIAENATTNLVDKQNEIKLNFNVNSNKYDDIYDKNTNQMHLLNSKRSFNETKYNVENNVKSILTVIYIILSILFLWLLYLSIFNNSVNIFPYLIIILFILIIIITYLNYFATLNIKYNEKFELNNSTIQKLSQVEIITSNPNIFNTTTFEYENSVYKMIIINDNVDIIVNQNEFLNFILIGKGETSSIQRNGSGGTINIYNDIFSIDNIKEQKTYNIIFNTDKSIQINSLNKATNTPETIMTVKNRNNSDDKNNIKVFINNNDYNTVYENPNNYKTLNAYSKNSNIDIDIRQIINYFIANKNNVPNSIYYGSAGNTNEDSILLNRYTRPNCYGLGGIYSTNANTDITGVNGACIIIYKEVEYSSLHLDMQTLINMHNNNINKYSFNNFNDLYIVDNNLIYNNSISSFQKKYKVENTRRMKYNKLENNLNENSNQFISNALVKYEIIKSISYLFVAFIILLVLYKLIPEYFKLSLLVFLLIIMFIIGSLFYNISIYTHRDHYKYYWVQPSNLNKLN